MDHQSDFLVIIKGDDIPRISEFLQGRQYNCVHSTMKDKNGNPMIGIKKSAKGQKSKNCGLIVCMSEELHAAALRIVQANKRREEYS